MGRKKNDGTKANFTSRWSERFDEVWREYQANNSLADDGRAEVGESIPELGRKDDRGKPEMFRGIFRQFPRALRAVAACSSHGAVRYGWENWKRVPEGFERYSDAMVRHLAAESEETPFDHDSGEHHASHVCWNSLARLELLLIEMEQNDKSLPKSV